MAPKKQEMCSECGAELRLGPDRCPLCGAAGAPAKKPATGDREGYHLTVQELRDQLRKLREGGAEAV